MIKGFLFDYDGVMTKNNNANTPPSEKLARILNKPLEEVNELFMLFWPDYLRGKIDDAELWSSFESRTGLTIPTKQRDIWSKWEQLQPLVEMVELIAYLHAEGYPIGLLTNVAPTTEREVRLGGGYNGFDFLVKSCEVGYAKPDPEIYTLAMSHFTALQPHEVIFIDDRERFLVPARATGMQTLLSTSSSQVIKEIHAILVV